MIVIIDYNLGNLGSVLKAFKAIRKKAVITNVVSDILKADRIVLPGVGSFGDGMKNLRQFNLAEPLKEALLYQKKPFLGICLGMQLLATEGFEFGWHKGLGIVKGRVEKIKITDLALRLPHMGWNDVVPYGGCPLFVDIDENDPSFYFAHSYHFIPESERVIAGITNYGVDLVAAIHHENIMATQFHPEKSQANGLQVLKNFLNV